jgi:hypothetical protein
VLQPAEQRGHRRLVEARTQSARSLICIEQTSTMFLPSIFEDRASLLSRLPSHSGQIVNVTAHSTKARMCGFPSRLKTIRSIAWRR